MIYLKRTFLKKGFAPALVLIITALFVGVIGGYQIGIKKVVNTTIPTQYYPTIQSAPLSSIQPSPLVVNTISNSNNFEVNRIERLIEFYGSDEKLKKIIVVKLENPKRVAYITDENLNKTTAKKIHEDTDQSIHYIEVTENTPTFSPAYGPKIRYIVLWLRQGDGSDIVIADEFGKIITSSLHKTNPEFYKAHVGFITFKGWVDEKDFTVQASGYQTGTYSARIDATSGKIKGGLEKI